MSTTASPLMLRMDAKSLAILFPEGSEARVDLQKAVIADFVRKGLKDYLFGHSALEHLSKARVELSKEIDEAKEALLKNSKEICGVSGDTWRGFTFSEDAKKAIRVEAYNAITAQVREAMKEQATLATAKVEQRIEKLVQDHITKTIATQVEAAVKERLAEVMASFGMKTGGGL